jgi:predicted DNA-binding antitoxin AbrB/MazE fold protein
MDRMTQVEVGSQTMAISVEATYEDGVLKPSGPLTLREHARVLIVIHPVDNRASATAGLIPCTDATLIEHVALDPAEDL